MKQIFKLSLYLTILCIFISCNEGLDASLFNNTNELIITGKNKGDFEFDHLSVQLITNLYDNSSLSGTPEKRLIFKMTESDEQGNDVEVNEKTVTFINAISPGDYYAYAFIDLNHNSKVDANEPYDIWLNSTGTPKVIQVREESRWKLLFEFEKTYPSYK